MNFGVFLEEEVREMVWSMGNATDIGLLTLHYGLLGEDIHTLEDIAQNHLTVVGKGKLRERLRKLTPERFLRTFADRFAYKQRRARGALYEANPRSIPFGHELIFFKGELERTDVSFYPILHNRGGIRTLGDLADYTPEDLRSEFGLSDKGIRAVARHLEKFGIPWHRAQGRPLSREEIVNNWQRAFE